MELTVCKKINYIYVKNEKKKEENKGINKCGNVIHTPNGMLHRPINSLSCFPVDAVTAISFINFRKPFTPFTSKNFVIFSPTVSAGSKSHTSTTKVSAFGSSLIGLAKETIQVLFDFIVCLCF